MIKYVKGDLFASIPSDEKILIAHIVNNADQMGSGFVVPLYTKWPIVKQQYHQINPSLGDIDFIKVEDNITVVNMCAQDNLTTGLDKRCHYGYLAFCMHSVLYSMNEGEKIYAPKFGAGIGGADWSVIEELINGIWGDLDVTVFEL